MFVHKRLRQRFPLLRQQTGRLAQRVFQGGHKPQHTTVIYNDQLFARFEIVLLAGNPWMRPRFAPLLSEHASIITRIFVETTIEPRIQESFNRQTLLVSMGAVLTQAGEGTATIELPFRPDLTQQHGFIHAGVVTMIVDTACGYASLSLMPPTAAVLTVEFKVNFLTPAAGEKLIARGRVLKPGRTLMVCYGEVHAINHGEEKLVATMLATMIERADSGLVG